MAFSPDEPVPVHGDARAVPVGSPSGVTMPQKPAVMFLTIPSGMVSLVASL
ncbi:MAG: hypothetical protein AVDCRST_MAG03-202 [uncultured Rubrobacteraceae bacterium]|uniref:Uncharacterized protein n=1 Tax=uncultured Rubrobacteraceae bacterium TaxID=349277 RepID=A0A6J4NHA0_9ACTN|nr:MAG: hypothetical protein AVDCRST_MAG03-202 [uncultured Rubrobacteraceae bacterium]